MWWLNAPSVTLDHLVLVTADRLGRDDVVVRRTGRDHRNTFSRLSVRNSITTERSSDAVRLVDGRLHFLRRLDADADAAIDSAHIL